MKRVVIAPDSFKGTLSSADVCRIVGASLKERYSGIEIDEIPVADGGEGTAEALLHAVGGEKIYCTVKSPLGRDIAAYFVMLPDKTAVIEMALASGLTLEKENKAMLAFTYGTGQLIKAALDKGAERLFIGIGGSATTDAGTGCLNALGVKFYDGEGKEVSPCGKSLEAIGKIDLTDFDRRIAATEITVLCDVKNPLYGKEGAAYIFAPQKGADENDVVALDRGLESFARVSEKTLGKDFSSYEGSGAAGGLGFALVAFMGAQLKRGIDLVLDFCGFENKAENADLVITGEGRLDSQSLMGKVPFGVASRCKGKRIIALVGVNEVPLDECVKTGISEVIETNPEHLPFDKIKDCAKEMLYAASGKIKL